MRWVFNDGTIAVLGGSIEGASDFASALREQLARQRVGVAFGPMPDGGAWLDRDDPALFDAWLRQEMGRPFRRALELQLLEAPAVPPLPEQEYEPLPEGAIP